MKKLLPFIAVLALLIAGCQKDEAGFPNKDTVVTITTTGTSTGTFTGTLPGTWFLKDQVSRGIALGISVDGDQSSFTKDDYFLFKSDNTCTISESGPVTVTPGTYTYDTTKELLVITSANDGGSYTVTKLTTDSLVLYYSINQPTIATVFTATLRFAHK